MFSALDDLGPDLNDIHREARSLGLWLDSDNTDILVMFRQVGDQYEGGHRDRVFASGIWEHVTDEQMVEVIATLGELPDSPPP